MPTPTPAEPMLRDFHIEKGRSLECVDAQLILAYSVSAAQALMHGFHLARLERGGKKGMTTDAEQDILRAALVMSLAGMDATLKQLLKDALPQLIRKYEKIRLGLEAFIRRELKGVAESGRSTAALKFLSEALASPHPQTKLIEGYVSELTGDSLQSFSKLCEVVDALALNKKDVGLDESAFRPIFDVRNQIIHEMDMNLNSKRRFRNLRSLETMIGYIDQVTATTEAIFVKVDELLKAK